MADLSRFVIKREPTIPVSTPESTVDIPAFSLAERSSIPSALEADKILPYSIEDIDAILEAQGREYPWEESPIYSEPWSTPMEGVSHGGRTGAASSVMRAANLAAMVKWAKENTPLKLLDDIGLTTPGGGVMDPESMRETSYDLQPTEELRGLGPKLLAGATQFGIDIPQIAGMSLAGGPMVGLPAFGMMSLDPRQSTWEDYLIEAVKGAALGGTLKAASNIPSRMGRSAVGGAAFGGLAATEEDISFEDFVAQSLLGLGMGAMGKGRRPSEKLSPEAARMREGFEGEIPVSDARVSRELPGKFEYEPQKFEPMISEPGAAAMRAPEKPKTLPFFRKAEGGEEPAAAPAESKWPFAKKRTALSISDKEMLEKASVVPEEAIPLNESIENAAQAQISFKQQEAAVELSKESPPVQKRNFETVLDDVAKRKDIGILTILGRDFFRNTRRVFGDAADKEVLIPLENAKDKNIGMQDRLLRDHADHIENRLGIKPHSKMDRAVMDYGEGKREFKEIMHEFGQEGANKIVEADKWYRNMYNMLLTEYNAVMRKLYPNVPSKQVDFRTNYYHHFRDPSGIQGLAELFDTPAQIPAEMAGISWFTEPRSKFMVFAQRRIGDKSTRSAAAGFARYIRNVSQGINISPQISNLRAWNRSLVAATGTQKPTAEEMVTMKSQVASDFGIELIERKDGKLVAPKGTAEQINSEVKRLVRKQRATPGSNNLTHYIDHVTDIANDMAGKTNPADRFFQKYVLGRKVLKVTNWLNARVKTNTILGNASSVIAQAFNVPQAIGVAKHHSVPAIYDTMADVMLSATKGGRIRWKANKPMAQSRFLKERYFDSNYNRFEQSWIGKATGLPIRPRVKQAAAWAMLTMDEVATRFSWNAMYRKAKADGQPDPIRYADNRTRDMVAGRGIGEVPLIHKSKMFQLVAPFQVEVGNAVWAMQDMALKKDIGAIATFMVASYMMNRAAEEIRGSPVSFDPIDAGIEGIKAAADPELDIANKIAVLTGRMAGEALSNIPLGQSIAEMYSAYIPKLLGDKVPSGEDFFGNRNPGRYGSGVMVLKGLADPVYKVIPAFGGVQLNKTIGGAKALMEGEVRSRSGKTKLYDVPDTPENVFKGLLFGKYATNDAQTYFDSKRDWRNRSSGGKKKGKKKKKKNK